ncbi:MAG: peptidase S8, partial [Ignavibacteriae bacterium HGW-Ignavibacteriae-2]
NTENVNLTVYDVLGSKVITLVNKQQSLGSYNATFNSRNLPSGVYFYTLQTGGFSQTKKMVILR